MFGWTIECAPVMLSCAVIFVNQHNRLTCPLSHQKKSEVYNMSPGQYAPPPLAIFVKYRLFWLLLEANALGEGYFLGLTCEAVLGNSF